ncbi:hypothetical protein [Streptomyces rochei]|uniref:hypothetical protein n=1 Tax=Streptomyces rochei TaxID=1928 RepID=UPI0035307F74
MLIPVVVSLATNSDDDKAGKNPGPSVSTSEDTTPAPTGTPVAPVAPPSATPSDTQSSAPASYEVVYDKEPMTLGLGGNPDVYAIDFDAPSSRHYSEEEWNSLKADAEETGAPIEPDLSYSNSVWGNLALRDGRNAAQLKPEHADDSAEACARRAQLGGFRSSQLWGSEEKLQVKTVFCILTDKGNVVRAQITRFIGNDPGDPPSQIEFTATMWSRSSG